MLEMSGIFLPNHPLFYRGKRLPLAWSCRIPASLAEIGGLEAGRLGSWPFREERRDCRGRVVDRSVGGDKLPVGLGTGEGACCRGAAVASLDERGFPAPESGASIFLPGSRFSLPAAHN